MRRETLALLETQAEQGQIEIFYGDEAQVAQSGYVPYAWQFKGEQVSVPAGRGRSVHCFGLLFRSCAFRFRTSERAITSSFVLEELETFSLSRLGQKPAVVVLDGARIHTAKKIRERLAVWQQRGLYVYYLPPYSPHLNIIERLWKELKARWDYADADGLFYATWQALSAVGRELTINFKPFRQQCKVI